MNRLSVRPLLADLMTALERRGMPVATDWCGQPCIQTRTIRVLLQEGDSGQVVGVRFYPSGFYLTIPEGCTTASLAALLAATIAAYGP